MKMKMSKTKTTKTKTTKTKTTKTKIRRTITIAQFARALNIDAKRARHLLRKQNVYANVETKRHLNIACDDVARDDEHSFAFICETLRVDENVARDALKS